MEVLYLQIALSVIMFVTTVIAGLSPIKLLQWITKKDGDEPSTRTSLILSLLSCFAGGVFLGTCFLEILPHVHHNFDHLKLELKLESEFPAPEFLACVGFFVVYALEEIILICSGHDHHSHSHNTVDTDAEEPLDPVTSKGNSLDEIPRFRERRYTTVSAMTFDETAVVEITNAPHTSKAILKSITFAAAMSFHCVLEGLALGVKKSHSGTLTLFFSLMMHKGIEAFSVGLQIAKSHTERMRMAVITICIYSLMTPLGSMLGVMLQQAPIEDTPKNISIIILEGMAVGTFIYVTFFEVILHERENEHSSLLKLLSIIVGFLVIAAQKIVEHHEDTDFLFHHGNGTTLPPDEASAFFIFK